jgi:tetratricopeptide (TPR) repeat protein
MLLAELHLAERDPARAREQVAVLLADQPNHPQALLLLGNIALAEGRLEEARKTFAGLAVQSPDNPAAHQRLGMVEKLRKNDAQAAVHFEKALSLAPQAMEAFAPLVAMMAARGEYPQAIARCEKQLMLVAGNPAVRAAILTFKGQLHRARKDPAAAEKAFQEAIAADAGHIPPYYSLARLLLDRGQTEQAVAQYEALIARNPRLVGPHMLLGTIRDMQRRPEESQRHYRAALAIDPDFAPAANNLAYLLSTQEGDLNEALTLAQTAKRRLPEDPSVMDTLGWIYYRKGLYDNALGELAVSAEKLSDNPLVRFHLGMALFRKGQGADAQRELKRALELDPHFDGSKEAREVLAQLG